MGRIYFVADVHLGNHRQHGGAEVAGVNARCGEIAAILGEAMTLPQAGDTIVILGDLFDSARPSPQVISAAMAALSARATGVQVVILVGNHDRRSDAPGDTALAPLDWLTGVDVVERPMVLHRSGARLLLVPYMPDQCSADLIAEVKALGDTCASHTAPVIVGLHAGIIGDDAAPWAQAARNAITNGDLADVTASVGADFAISGDWHSHAVYENFNAQHGHATRVIQCGALVPTGWNNPGLDGYGTIYEWSAGKLVRHEVSGPRYVRTNTAGLAKLPKDTPHTLRVRIDAADADEEAAARADSRVCTVARADIDPKASATQAANAARSSASIEQAISAYCRNMDLPEGIDPALVAQTARSYLGSSDES